jgi:hypothetical protein
MSKLILSTGKELYLEVELEETEYQLGIFPVMQYKIDF